MLISSIIGFVFFFFTKGYALRQIKNDSFRCPVGFIIKMDIKSQRERKSSERLECSIKREKNTEKMKPDSFYARISDAIRQDGEGQGGGIGIMADLGYVLLGFLFGGCHLFFGAYPLGISLIAVLGKGSLLALIGVVLGSLTLGKNGIIYALIATLVLLLRVIISGGEKKLKQEDAPNGQEKSEQEGGALSGIFGIRGQSLVVRAACGVIAGFISAIYEILLSGLSLTTVLFGTAMIIAPAVLIFVFSGFFDSGIGIKALLFGGKKLIFPPLGKSGVSKFDGILLRISSLSLIFLVSFSLKKYAFFGVDLAFIFAALVTLFVAKRFGDIYGGVCGFVASFGISAPYSVSFALAGVGSGALFCFGTPYALLGGGILLSLWGVYIDGVTGLFSVLVEYVISALCLVPVFGFFEREKRESADGDAARQALDMVGTMALAYRNKTRESTEALESALNSLSPVIRRFLSGSDGVCQGQRKTSAEDYYDLFARMFEDARNADDEMREMDDALTEKLEAVFRECGFPDGVIRAFGKRRKYFIAAGEDRSGELITSPRLFAAIEEQSRMKLSAPDYFRRGDMVLMECAARPKFRLEMTYSQRDGASGEISGDSIRFFETSGGESFLLISDGMGSGGAARETSRFACDFLSKILGTGVGMTAALHGLNGVIRDRAEECSVTVDLLSIDMLSGNATFVKSSAPPSFIKRGDSLFRIKSETMPLGLLKRIDAESIASSLQADDVIVMISDGVADNGDDAPWLLELLGAPIAPGAPLKPFAEKIIRLAAEQRKRPDDMTVAVARLKSIL